MKKSTNDKIWGVLAPLVTLAAVICFWAVAARVADNEYVVPPVGVTVKEFFGLFGKADFYAAFFNTLLRSALAFCISFVLAGLCAFAAKKNALAEKFILPIIAVLRALPTVAVVLLLLVWTNSRVAPVIVTMLVVLPTLYTNLKNAAEGIDGELVEMCKVYGVSKREIFFKIKAPAVLPQVTRAAGAGLSLNLKLMVAAEVLSQTAVSLGYLLNTSKVYFETAKMIALVFACVLTGLAFEFVFNRLAALSEKWK